MSNQTAERHTSSNPNRSSYQPEDSAVRQSAPTSIQRSQTPPPANPTRRRRGPLLTEKAIKSLARNYLRSDKMGRDERARVVSNLFFEGGRRIPFVHRFGALMVLSSTIAVLGLLADSTAVVIGAMIVAPLMGPVLGISAALVMDWPRRAAESAVVASAGSLLAIALAAVAAFVLPSPTEIPGEVLARTAPNLLDLGVAVAAGSAGAYAQVRRAAGEALTGVAVAVALVPPLAVVGITLQMGEITLAAGAFLLFLANVAGIVLAAALTFMVCGLVPSRRLMQERNHVARGFRLAMAAVLLILAPLELTDQWRERRPISDDETRSAVQEVLEESNPGAAVIAVDVDTEDGERTIDITASTSDEPIDVEDLAEDLSEELDVGFELEVTTLEAKSQKATVEEADDGEADVAVETDAQDPAEGSETEDLAEDAAEPATDDEQPTTDEQPEAGDEQPAADDEQPEAGESPKTGG